MPLTSLGIAPNRYPHTAIPRLSTSSMGGVGTLTGVLPSGAYILTAEQTDQAYQAGAASTLQVTLTDSAGNALLNSPLSFYAGVWNLAVGQSGASGGITVSILVLSGAFKSVAISEANDPAINQSKAGNPPPGLQYGPNSG